GVSVIVTAAVPALAQDHPRTSTPEERAQTQQLNAQAAQGTTASPSELNGELTSSPQMAQTTDPAQYEDQQQQYQQQQQQYRNQQQRYQEQRAQYHAAQRQYVSDVREYDVQR